MPEFTVTVRYDVDDERERRNPDNAWSWSGSASYPGDALELALFAWHAERREAEDAHDVSGRPAETEA